MVGDLIGEGAAQEAAVVGETPNLAARLQALAEPGSVVISQATRRLTGGLFELADLGPRRLKGFAAPVPAWRVVGAGVAESRFDALRGRHLSPLVGREEELGLLFARWRRAADGEGQVVLLSGEPGIGKSRIVQALRERLAGQPHIRSATTARPTTAPVRSIRSSACWSVPPGSPGTTRPKSDWASSRLCSPGGPSAWPRPCR